MTVLTPPGHLHPTVLSSLVMIVMALTLTLTLTCGRVIGMPFVPGTSNSRDDEAPLEAMANDISDRLTRLTAHLEAQGVQLRELRTELARVTQSVSFTVIFSGRDIGDLESQQVLKFDKVLVNAGDGYNPQTGFFTAPSDGLYAFYIQISRHPSDPDGCVEVDLVRGFRKRTPTFLSQNQEPQLIPSAVPKSQKQSSSALPFPKQVTTVSLCIARNNSTSSRTVLHLDQGDTLHAQMRSGTKLLGDFYTTMSGIKLGQLSPFLRTLLH